MGVGGGRGSRGKVVDSRVGTSVQVDYAEPWLDGLLVRWIGKGKGNIQRCCCGRR